MRQYEVKHRLTITAACVDDIARRYGLQTGREIAEKLNVSEMSVSRYRNRRATFDAPVAKRAAELLELDAGELIARLEAERATDPTTRKLWEDVAQRLGKQVERAVAGVAATLLFWAAPVDHARPAVAADNV